MTGENKPGSPEEIEIRLLLEALYLRYHYDFRNYAMSSIRRRLRQAREQLELPSFSAMQERLLRDPAMLPQLLRFLTVQVSDMFRDPDYFRAIRERVIPHLRTYPSLKVWIAGCSSGEELYSMVILFREEGLEDRTLFYATDINQEALQAAEAGVYAIERVQSFTANHQRSGGRTSLSDYYQAAYGRVSFDKSLRRNVVFSDHSLVTDAVFGEMNLISCRNVLIYFDNDLKDRVLGLFRESLAHRGFLGLGAKESVRFSAEAASFADFVREEKIYQRVTP
ncbi:protein-glutamate O-methyltransferase CheR [Brucella pseudogrignonensis]|jgi:chemotaxis protein methyltransferase CheR|uniref:Protein-glutamate O-methyltransferase CheR n=1 Tax=Brucella pseudogrignonensis TaxID=419475 RepID=A0A7Y3TA49_9HYPH|nr:MULTISPECIES: CheR family methyltransferase [Brucella]MBK0022823.1 protein-glutamate O-methyltransferase CheR [Ochrobactrum sp. S45]MBK0044838.1 protein-glutamate O-methyltransferase CheR [Ochrobactrum sp. S46]MCD4512250.1 protein-glutamate O-methyltransferase CheR [Brucella pseudogrignonensis]NNV23648.1 protein-glutamate O-methyltransferase CheR [Brucella pseudogrignonensis]UKK95751.1 protein-glutamate O-methyltransferase CheR [Brucella pseudogrignonensis]